MIYILGTPTQTSKWLDDKALGRQIKDIAQVLCNVHHMVLRAKGCGMATYDWQTCYIPLFLKLPMREWSEWACKRSANYCKLVDLGMVCCEEWDNRYGRDTDQGWLSALHKMERVIQWCRANQPELPYGKPDAGCIKKGMQDSCTPDHACDIHAYAPTPYPLVIPDKYLELINMDTPIPECYIVYYAMVLRNQRYKKFKCKECGGFGIDNPGACSDPGCCGYTSDCGPCNGTGYITKPEPTWTRRKVPVWAKPTKLPPLSEMTNIVISRPPDGIMK